MKTTDVLIIGAGLAGLSAARELMARGLDVLLLEKSRGLGGRAATRRVDGVPVDHGAQFFTARSPAFLRQVAAWEAAGVCFAWSRGFHRVEQGVIQAPESGDAHPRYACATGMTALAKGLAEGLSVERSCRVVRIRRMGAGFEAESEDGRFYAGRRLLCSAPIPQAVDLLGGLLDTSALAVLAPVRVEPCFAVVAQTHGLKPVWRGLQIPEGDLNWVGADFTKRPAAPAPRFVVLHSSAPFALRHLDTPHSEIARHLLAEAARVDPAALGGLVTREVHRWRFAKAAQPVEGLSFLATDGIFLIGDAFGGKIESAWLSGRAAAEAILGSAGD